MFLYIFDPLDFIVKSVIEISKYEITEDDECNSNSFFWCSVNDKYENERTFDAQENDIVFVKQENTFIYSGVIKAINREDSTFKFTTQDIINVFSETILISNQQLIKTTGIEDFISTAININYTVGAFARNFIRPHALTHTPIQASVNTENGIYNLGTFMQNCRQNYDLKIDFVISEDEQYLDVNLHIDNTTPQKKIVDLTTKADVVEVSSASILSYVKVVSKDGSIYELFLKNDRTTTTNPTDPDIVFGKMETIYTENSADARQEALNRFKSNRYEHYFNFKDTTEYKMLEKIIIKNKKGESFDTYISGIKRNGNGLKEYTCGNLRIKFIDKFLKEMR